MLVDSHCHLNFKAYQNDLSAVIGRCQQAQMKVINVGAALATSQKAVELTKHDNLYAALGLHPIHVYDEEFNLPDYQKLINNKVVAIGETGLDYYHLQEALQKGATSLAEIKQRQVELFKKHLQLAQTNNLPVIIHGRNGQTEPTVYQDIFKILKDNNITKGVVHCYGGNLAEAKQFINLGLYLGFTGVVTFDKTGILEQIIKWIPAERMLIETDAPYLAPEPFRGKRNEPIYVKYVAEKIAQILGKTTEEIIETTGNNAIKLFKL